MKFAGLLLLIGFGLSVTSCRTIKPYEKEYLLSPLMDDSRVAPKQSGLMASACGAHEKLANAGVGAGGGSDCPTCGG